MRDVWRRSFQAEGRASAKTLRRVVGGEVTEIKGRGTFVKKPFMAGVTGPLTCKTLGLPHKAEGSLMAEISSFPAQWREQTSRMAATLGFG